MANNKIKPITLEVEEDLWVDFKNTVPRTKTLNQAIVELIENSLEEKKCGCVIRKISKGEVEDYPEGTSFIIDELCEKHKKVSLEAE